MEMCHTCMDVNKRKPPQAACGCGATSPDGACVWCHVGVQGIGLHTGCIGWVGVLVCEHAMPDLRTSCMYLWVIGGCTLWCSCALCGAGVLRCTWCPLSPCSHTCCSEQIMWRVSAPAGTMHVLPLVAQSSSIQGLVSGGLRLLALAG